uniref:DUF1995 domain-containing protein n=1 Tax=Eucampia antarctica TaxID=49252 RepID=A0A7S2SHX4_9STRA
MMKCISYSFCALALLPKEIFGLIPSTPLEQTQRAIQSLRKTIEEGSKRPHRLYVDYLIPLPIETDAADIDPWPGGLAQMYPYAETILADILNGVVDEANGECSSQVLSPQDCCGFFVQESKTSPKNDIAAILFPSVDQLDKIQELQEMVGDRTLIIFNRQFTRPADFGFGNKEKSQENIFDKFKWGFAFQEFACRSEDVKLTFEYPDWNSCAICSEDEDLGATEFALLSPQPDRPQYSDLESKLNEILPEPLWMRKIGEAGTKGLKFQREKEEE